MTLRRIFLGGLAAALALPLAARDISSAVRRAIEGEPALRGASVGVSIKDMDGNTLADIAACKRLVPASNLKLVTTGCALLRRGAAWRFKTLLFADHDEGMWLRDSILHGNLRIRGGGDPMVDENYFERWKDILDSAGIKAIEGDIIGDGSAWSFPYDNGSWSYEDIGTYYGAGADGLCFYKNAIDFSVRAGKEVGDEVFIEKEYPRVPWLTVRNNSVTGPKGSGNSLYLFTGDFSSNCELRGSYAIDRRPKTEHFANKHGALTCAYLFRNYLISNGISVSGSYGTVASSAAFPCSTELGRSFSPSLEDLVLECNRISDNFLAEALLRQAVLVDMENAGPTFTHPADSCLERERIALTALFLQQDGGIAEDAGSIPGQIKIVDGCGLSRQNLLSPDFITEFLLRMYCNSRNDVFLPFYQSLPRPGEYTLKDFNPAKGGTGDAGRFSLKSGSMDGILCYSGYINERDGATGRPVYSVSVMVNGALAPQSALRRALERVFAQISAALPN